MRKIKSITCAAALIALLSACSRVPATSTASGSFEAEETIISAGAAGTIEEFKLTEGESVVAGQQLGYIDSTQLHLKKEGLRAQIAAILDRKPEISVQLSALQQQLDAAETERDRTAALLQGDAATQQQLDQAEAEIKILRDQIQAQRSALSISSRNLELETVPLRLQIEQLNDQLEKCKIVSPIAGTVLLTYAREKETTANGKPLFKLADLSRMILRVYLTGDQLPRLKLGQSVTVLTDDGEGGLREGEGELRWINDKAEFTPKTIQTRNERANLVYAAKVSVKNDGTYKIGMYGEIKFE